MGIRQTPEAKTKGKAQFAGMGLQEASGGGSYTLPVASASVLGGVKVGSRLSIESDGTLSAADQSTPIASTSVAGKVIPDGSSITVAADGTISASGGDVPIATTSVAGKVKPDGSTITVESDGTISSVDQTPIATTSVAGKVIPDGTSITVQSDGTIAAVGGPSYTLPAATTTTLGGVIVGSRLTVAADGTLNAADQSTPIATTSVAGKVKPDGTSITVDANGVISAVWDKVATVTGTATTTFSDLLLSLYNQITVDPNGVYMLVCEDGWRAMSTTIASTSIYFSAMNTVATAMSIYTFLLGPTPSVLNGVLGTAGTYTVTDKTTQVQNITMDLYKLV